MAKTYRELKDFLGSLDENQLDQQVRIVKESETDALDFFEILQEDMINPSGDGCEPLSAYSDPEFDDYDKEIVAHAGDVWLCTKI